MVTTNEIIPKLYLGDMADATQFSGKIICLTHEAIPSNPHAIWMPLLRGENMARVWQMDAVADLIDKYIGEVDVLVHCAGGIDRAPLVVAWFLHTKRGMTIDNAYLLIKEKRPQINQHKDWII
jgi:protein-tyrosine phosphatase